MKKIDWGHEAVRSQEIVFSIVMGAVALLSQGNPLLEYPQILWVFAAILAYNLGYHLILRRYGGWWVVPLVSVALNTVLVSGILWKSGGAESNYWPMYLLPIFTACMYLEKRHVLLALASAAGFLICFYLDAVWAEEPWQIMELTVKVGVLSLSAAITGHFAALERNARQGMERNRAELDRLAGTLAHGVATAEAADLATLGRLLDGVMHNVNNGLMVILGSSEMLLDEEEKDPAKRRDLERIRSTARAMGQLTADLLKWARPEQAPEQVDLGAALGQAAALLDYKLKRKRVVLRQDFPEGLPRLSLPPGRIQQAFVALLFQAADRAEAGGAVALSASSDGGDVTVRIRWPAAGGGDPAEGLETAAGLLALHGAELRGSTQDGQAELSVAFKAGRESVR